MARELVMDESDRLQDGSEDTVTKVKNAVTGTAEKAQARVGEAGRALQDKIDENRGPAADKLQGAAAKLHETADSLPGAEKVSNLAHSAAGKIEATAEYMREHDVRDMMADLETFVRRHPGQSMIAAAAVGFLLGRAFKSED